MVALPSKSPVGDTANAETELRRCDLGLIPCDWECAPIGEHIDLLTGFPFPSSGYAASGIRLLRGSNVKRNCTDWSNELVQFWPEVSSELRKYALREADIVVAMDGSLVGRSFASLTKDDLPALLLQRVARIRSKSMSQGYLAKWICSDYFTKHCDSVKTVTAIPHISPEDIRSFKILSPPTIEEQRAIAEALSDTDALIESLEALIAKKRAIKQGAMQDLLSGRKRLPGFGGEWERRTFGEIFDFYPTATNSRADLQEDGNSYYVHYGDIHTAFNSHLNFSKERVPRIDRSRCRNAATIENCDWIMADVSEDYDGVCKSVEVLGLQAGATAISGLHTFLLREKSATFAPGFKGHLGNSGELRRQYLRVMTGMKVYGVSKRALKDLTLPIPGWTEQEAIRDILDDLDAELEAVSVRLEKARQIKQGMMQELLTGRVRLV